MLPLARLLVQRRSAALWVALVVLLTVVAGAIGSQVRHEDDLLAFLPRDNPDIARFRDINERFGGLDVAIVGVELAQPYTRAELAAMAALTNDLSTMGGLDYVLSVTSVDDFSPDPMGGIRTAKLIEALPEDDAQLEAVRALVSSREHVVGTLVSADGAALALYAFPAFGADQRALAGQIQARAAAAFPGATLHLTGAPFVSSYIYDTTQADMRRLTPWAVAAIVLVLLVAFRDLRSVLLGLFSAGAGIAVVQAVMVLTGTPVNVVLSAMPVILFAVGSAYGIHVLARYSAYASALPLEAAVIKTITHTGPVVLTAGLTTALGLGSFVMMDLGPLRQFGLLCALGVSVAVGLSLTFVPAVIVLLRLKPRPVGAGGADVALARMSAWVVRRRVPVLVVLCGIGGMGAIFAAQVDDRLDQAAFYDPGSPPDAADAFMRRAFGGSTFVQIEITGDLRDPYVLRSVQQLADRLSLRPGVHRVQQVGDVVASLSEAMEGQPRLPDRADKAGLLFGLLTGNPAVRQLVSPELDRALMHVRLSAKDIDETEATLADIERIVAEEAVQRWRVVPIGGDRSADPPEATAARDQLVIDRLRAVLRGYGAPEAEVLRPLIAAPAPAPTPAQVSIRLGRWLSSEESPAPLPPQQAALVAAALLSLQEGHQEDDRAEAIAGALGATRDDPRVGDLSWATEIPLQEARRDAGIAAQAAALLDALPALSGRPAPHTAAAERLELAVGAALLERGLDAIAVADPKGEGQLSLSVSGTPLLHRGLSQSTRENQQRSLVLALGLVAVVLAWRFRSLSAGLLALAPTGLSLLLVYGGMGLLHIRLDIGTAMLASIVIGAGVDYAVHLMSAWSAAPEETVGAGAARAGARTGSAILINAIAVAAGFFVLTLGEARPLKNVGALTSAAMLVAAGCTLVVVPALARRRRYDPQVDADDPADPPSLRAAAAAPAPTQEPTP
jgi:predicted RND superfamily exporter protein